METIRSTGNEQIKDVRRLRSKKGRRASGRTIVEGPAAVASLAGSQIVPEAMFVLDRDSEGIRMAETLGRAAIAVTEDVLRSMSDTKNPRGPLAVIPIPPWQPIRTCDQVALCDVADPGNVGAIIRTAVALGFDVTLNPSSADPWNPKVIRSSAGTIFRAHLARWSAPEDLESAGLDLWATVVTGGRPPERPEGTGAVGVLIGSEAHGLPAALIERATTLVTIPMTSATESLNAAVAAGIVMHALRTA